MKKKVVLILMATMMLSMSVTACSNKKNAGIELGTESTEVKLQNVKVDDGEVNLCEYKGLMGELKVSQITESDIEEWKNEKLEEYTTEEEVDRAVQEEDYVTVNMKASVDGQAVDALSDDGVQLGVGYQEYGEEFDAAIIGKSKGDKYSVSVSYDENWDAEIANKTVDYEVEIVSVAEYKTPELTDEFIKETLGYESEDAFNEAINKEIEQYNSEENKYETQSQLLQYIIDNSEFVSYSDDLYATCKDEIEAEYSSYGEMFGCSTLDEVYEMFEVTEEDVEKEIVNRVYSVMVIHAIAQLENIELTDADYQEQLERQVEMGEFESTDEIEEEYEKDYLMDQFLSIKVNDFIYDNAVIEKVEAPADDEEIEEVTEE